MIDRCTLETIQAMNARSGNVATPQLGANCRQTLEIGFFFDGMGRHLERDLKEGRVSNIGRLFSAYPSEDDRQIAIPIRRHYYSGLGTPSKPAYPKTQRAQPTVFPAKRKPPETANFSIA